MRRLLLLPRPPPPLWRGGGPVGPDHRPHVARPPVADRKRHLYRPTNRSADGAFLFARAVHVSFAAPIPRIPKRWLTLSWFCCLVGMGDQGGHRHRSPCRVFYATASLVSDSWREAIRRHWRYHLALASTLIFFLLLFWLSTIRAQAAGGLFTKAKPMGLPPHPIPIHCRYLRLSFVPTGLCLDYRWPLVHSPAESLAGTPGGGRPVVRHRLGYDSTASVRVPPRHAFSSSWPRRRALSRWIAIFEHRMYLPLASVLRFSSWPRTGYSIWHRRRTRRLRAQRTKAGFGLASPAGARWSNRYAARTKTRKDACQRQVHPVFEDGIQRDKARRRARTTKKHAAGKRTDAVESYPRR